MRTFVEAEVVDIKKLAQMGGLDPIVVNGSEEPDDSKFASDLENLKLTVSPEDEVLTLDDSKDVNHTIDPSYRFMQACVLLYLCYT